MSVSKSLLIPLALMALSVSAFADTKSPRSRRGRADPHYVYQYGAPKRHQSEYYVRPDVKSGGYGSVTGQFGGVGDIKAVEENRANSNSNKPRAFGTSKQGLKATGTYVIGEIDHGTYATVSDEYYPLENRAHQQSYGTFGGGNAEGSGYRSQAKGEIFSEGKTGARGSSAHSRNKHTGKLSATEGGFLSIGDEIYTSSGEKRPY